MKSKFKVYAQRDMLSRSIELHFVSEGAGGLEGIAKPMVFETRNDGAAYAEPAIRIDYEAAQQLMDELWHVGIRPTEGTGSAGSLAATERHLADMQTIVMHQLKITTTKAKA